MTDDMTTDEFRMQRRRTDQSRTAKTLHNPAVGVGHMLTTAGMLIAGTVFLLEGDRSNATDLQSLNAVVQLNTQAIQNEQTQREIVGEQIQEDIHEVQEDLKAYNDSINSKLDALIQREIRRLESE